MNNIFKNKSQIKQKYYYTEAYTTCTTLLNIIRTLSLANTLSLDTEAMIIPAWPQIKKRYV